MKRVAVLVVGHLVLWGVAHAASTESVRPGMRLPDVVLVDQHDVASSIPPETRLILFTRDMDAASIVKEALADENAALLAPAHAVCVADIAGMPSMITKMFALPAMRKRPYRLLLDRDGTLTAAWPSVEDEITVLQLDALTVQRVDYVDSVDALRALLRAAAQPTPAPP